jgi:transposase
MDNDYKGDYAYSPCSAASASAMRNGNRPTAVQQAFSSRHHQLLLLEVRSQAYERQLAQLREQVAQIDDLKAEMVKLRERLGQNSSNSSKPPSSDLPRQPQQVQRQPSGRKPGGQPDHPEMDASSKP